MEVTGILARKPEQSGERLAIANEIRNKDNNLGKVCLRRGKDSNS